MLELAMSQSINWVSQMQDSIKKAESCRIGSIQDQLEKIQAISHPINFASQIQEHIKNAETYRMKGIQEQLSKIQAISQPVNLASQIQNSIKKAESCRIGSIQDQLKMLHKLSQTGSLVSQHEGLMKGLNANLMGSILSQSKMLHEMSQTTRLVSEQEGLRKTLETYRMNNVFGLRKIFESTLELQRFGQSHTDLVSNVRISEDGSFSVGNESVSQEEVFESINDFSINYESNIDSINAFIDQLKNLSNPSIKAVLIYLFIPYFIAIFANLSTPYWEDQWNQYANLRTREVKKEIISNANENLSLEFLQEHHFVATNILYVRNYESSKAEIIDELYIGKIVKVLDKKRSWCLIEYQDSDRNELKQGWVFSRYLSRFNR